MEYKQLGNSYLEVSKISFGCMSLDPSKNNDHLLRSAVDMGINLFDTADLYDKGKNEKAVGKALKAKRSQIYLATKVGNQWRKDGSGWDWNPNKTYLIKAVEDSLRRLQTDYIDLYQLHGGTIDDPFEEALEAFEVLKAQGKILHYGISTIRPNVIHRWLEKSSLTSIMMQYSLLDRRPEEQCLNWAQNKQVGILARGSLVKGLLAGKPPANYLNHSEKEVADVQEVLKHLSTNRTAAQTTLRFVFRHPAVTTATVGIRTHDQLKEAIETFSRPDLNDDEYGTLQCVLNPDRYTTHLINLSSA